MKLYEVTMNEESPRVVETQGVGLYIEDGILYILKSRGVTGAVFNRGCWTTVVRVDS